MSRGGRGGRGRGGGGRKSGPETEDWATDIEDKQKWKPERTFPVLRARSLCLLN